MASALGVVSDIKTRSMSLIEPDVSQEGVSEPTTPKTQDDPFEEPGAENSGKKFFRRSFKNARTLLKSQFTHTSPVEESKEVIGTEKDQNNSTKSSSITETASSVLNKINPFESSSKSPGIDKKENQFFQKLEKKLGFNNDEQDEVNEGEEQQNKTTKRDSNNYANNNEGKMLEDLQTPECEKISLLSTSGSMKRKVKPVGAIEYQVNDNETIEKIALKWNTIPSEIQRLNRFSTRTLFPGQTIYVPDPYYVPPSPTEVKTPVACEREKEEEPSQSTPLAGGSFNIFKWKSNSAKPGHAEPASVYEERRASLGKRPSIDTRHQIITEDEAKKLDQECMQRFLKINCKIVTRSNGCHDGVIIITPSAIMFDPFDVTKIEQGSRKNSVDNSLPPSTIYDEASAIIPVELISNVIMYEDLQLKDVEEYFDYQQHMAILDYDIVGPENAVSFQIEEHKEDNSILKTSVDREEFAKNTSMFLHEDATNEAEELTDEQKSYANIEPSSSIDESTNNVNIESFKTETTSSTCYLCIKVNNNKNFVNCPMDRKMKNKLRSEFWFQIYDECFLNTDKICAFFLEWRAEHEFSSKHDQRTRRFQLIKDDERLADLIADNLTIGSSFCNKSTKSFNSTNRLINKEFFIKDWEIVNLYELESKLKLEMEIEKEYHTLPVLTSKSDILKDEHLRKLNVNLIPRAMGYAWIKSFSTDEQGFSLKHLYRQLSEVETPCLIVIQDTCRNIFGVMTDSKLYPSEHYYGTGESFLFTFYPKFKVYKWTGENSFFMRGNTESIGFGCGEGYHGLWLDGDLLNGHTQKSKTFDNEPLTSNEYFTLASLEVWTFSETD